MCNRSFTLRSILSAALSVLLLLSVIGLAGCNKPSVPTTEPTSEPSRQPSETAPTQPVETTTAPPGVEDSIFEDETTGTTQPTQPEETTNPGETTQPGETTNPTETTAPQQTKPTESTPVETTAPPETTVPPETTQPPETTTPPATDPPATEPPETEPTQGTVSPDSMTYEAYNALSASEQKAFMNSFASIDKFFDWYNAAKKAYEEANPPIDVGDGNVDIGDIIGGDN